MKLSNPLSLILMAAASSDVSGSKSGKGGARLADGDDYDWAVGRYTECLYEAIAMNNGEPFAIRSDFDCTEILTIERLGDDPNGLTFQATVLLPERVRRIFEGVGSYNPKYKGEIMFYADHVEFFNGTNWVTDDGAQESDVSTLRVSELDGDCSSVIADIYYNRQAEFIPGSPFQTEVVGTILFTEVNSE